MSTCLICFSLNIHPFDLKFVALYHILSLYISIKIPFTNSLQKNSHKFQIRCANLLQIFVFLTYSRAYFRFILFCASLLLWPYFLLFIFGFSLLLSHNFPFELNFPKYLGPIQSLFSLAFSFAFLFSIFVFLLLIS